MQFFRDISVSAVTAGFVAVLVGFTSSVAVVFQDAQSFGATPTEVASWIWALGLGMGLCTLIPSMWLRKPVMIAWSTPGAAVLAVAGASGQYNMQHAVGAFIVCASLIVLTGQMQWSEVSLDLATPVFTMPAFRWDAVVSLALPLFVVTMASQNLPGVAAIRASGYPLPVSKLVTLTGVATLILAPFGAFALNLSAITAAICMGPQAHPDSQRRYVAAAACGAFYVVVGLCGGLVASLLAAFPQELVVAIAGLALLGTIGAGLASAVSEETHREPALITFLVTLSGVTLFGVGSAFWGVVAGSVALFVQQYAYSALKKLS